MKGMEPLVCMPLIKNYSPANLLHIKVLIRIQRCGQKTHTHTPSFLYCIAQLLLRCRPLIHFQCPLLLFGASLSMVLDALGSERLLPVWTHYTAQERVPLTSVVSKAGCILGHEGAAFLRTHKCIYLFN